MKSDVGADKSKRSNAAHYLIDPEDAPDDEEEIELDHEIQELETYLTSVQNDIAPDSDEILEEHEAQEILATMFATAQDLQGVGHPEEEPGTWKRIPPKDVFRSQGSQQRTGQEFWSGSSGQLSSLYCRDPEADQVQQLQTSWTLEAGVSTPTAKHPEAQEP